MAMFSFFGKGFRDLETKIAESISRFAGSMSFVYLHILFFTFFFMFKPFQIEVFNILLSLEAVFLATFIMVTQNRQAELAEERAEEEEEEREDIEEDIEDIQEDFDALQRDLSEVRRLIEKIESRTTGAQDSLPMKGLAKARKEEKELVEVDQ